MKPLPRYTTDYAHGVLVFVRQYFERSSPELRCLSCSFLITIRMCQLIQHLHKVINHVLSEVPEGINFVILSQEGATACICTFGSFTEWLI